MKKTPTLIAFAIGLTLVLYMAVTYLLPGPPPSVALVGLFAAVALAIVFGGNALLNRRHSAKTALRKEKPETDGRKVKAILLMAALGGLGALQGCKAAPPTGSASFPSTMNRVTGTGLLLRGEKEEAGFGLYSYALLSHPPAAAELPQYRAFFKAMVALPTASSLEQYIPKERINLTLIPLTEKNLPEDEDRRVQYILEHYDFARSAVLLAALATKTERGPVLISVLQPIDPSAHPYPVLVQDLTRAQPTLMETYVGEFVDQVAQEKFWEQSSLGQFALSLRNSLETAAVGLGMSKTAVDSWVKFFGKAPDKTATANGTHKG